MAKSPASGIVGWSVAIATVAFFGLIMLIIFGNLSGNVGFAANSAGANNTNNYINNYTQSVTNTGKQLPAVGTILGIALLLVILIGLLIYALTEMRKVQGGSSGSSFG